MKKTRSLLLYVFMVFLFLSTCRSVKKQQNGDLFRFRNDPSAASQTSQSYLSNLQKSDGNDLNGLIIDDLSKEMAEDKMSQEEISKRGYAISPLNTYIIDKTVKTPESFKAEKHLLQDTSFVVCVVKKQDQSLGLVEAKKEGENWVVFNSQASKSDKNFESAPEKAIKIASKKSSNIFIIVYSAPGSTFKKYVVGYSGANKNIGIVKYDFGNIQEFDDIRVWLKESRLLL